MSSTAGLGPLLLLLKGTSAALRLIFLEDDGTPINLTGVTALKFVIKRDAYIADTYAIVSKVLANFTLTSPLSGIVDLAIAAADTATADSWGDYFYYAQATLPSGRVVTPDLLRGPCKLDLAYDATQANKTFGACIYRTDAPSGVAGQTVGVIPNYVLNRSDITALTSGGNSLAALDISTIKSGNPIISVFFTGSIRADYRLRLKGASSQSLPWLILSTNDASYIWELVGVMKEGVPAPWNPTTSKFHQELLTGSGTQLTSGYDPAGFTLPV